MMFQYGRPQMLSLPIDHFSFEVEDFASLVDTICRWWNELTNADADHFEVYEITPHGLKNCNVDDDWTESQANLISAGSCALIGEVFLIDFRTSQLDGSVCIATRDGREAIHGVEGDVSIFQYWSRLSLEMAFKKMRSQGFLAETKEPRIGKNELTAV